MGPETERLLENSFREQEKRLRLFQLLVFSLTYLSYFSLYMTRRPISVTKTRLKEKEGVTGFELAVIDTVYLSMYAVGQFTNGLIADRVGSRRILTIGLFGSGIACAAFGAIPIKSSSGSISLFVIAWAINGYFQACGWPGCIKALTPWFSAGHRGTVMGWWATCYQVGGIAGAAFATLIMDQLGWRWAYVIPAVLVCFTALLVATLLKQTPQEVGLISPLDAEDEVIAEQIGSGTVGDATGSSTSYGAINNNNNNSGKTSNNDGSSKLTDEETALTGGEEEMGLLKVLFLPGVLNLGLSYAIIKLIRYSLSYWLAYYLEEEVGYSDVTAGYLSVAFDSGGTVGSIVIGYLSDTVFGGRRVTVCFPALILVALSFVSYVYFGTGTAENVVILVMIGFFLYGPDTLLSSSAVQDIGGARAAASVAGVVNGLGSLGAILQAFTTYLVSEAYGWDAFWFLLAGLSVLAALSIIPLMRKELSPTWKPQTKNHKK